MVAVELQVRASCDATPFVHPIGLNGGNQPLNCRLDKEMPDIPAEVGLRLTAAIGLESKRSKPATPALEAISQSVGRTN